MYFGEFKRSLKLRSDKHGRSAKNCNCEKNEIVQKTVGKRITTLAGIKRKLLLGKASRVLGRSKKSRKFYI